MLIVSRSHNKVKGIYISMSSYLDPECAVRYLSEDGIWYSLIIAWWAKYLYVYLYYLNSLKAWHYIAVDGSIPCLPWPLYQPFGWYSFMPVCSNLKMHDCHLRYTLCQKHLSFLAFRNIWRSLGQALLESLKCTSLLLIQYVLNNI